METVYTKSRQDWALSVYSCNNSVKTMKQWMNRFNEFINEWIGWQIDKLYIKYLS